MRGNTVRDLFAKYRQQPSTPDTEPDTADDAGQTLDPDDDQGKRSDTPLQTPSERINAAIRRAAGHR